MSDAITTGKINAALLRSYPLPEYALFFEVGDATGGRHSRWADAVAMACWPSRGLRVLGFEVKASRADWLREKKSVTKSTPIQRYCDHWYLVTAPGVLQPEELPATWGHLELVGGKLMPRVTAPKLEPEALDRPFLAALLRRAGQANASIAAAALENEREAMKRHFEEQVEARARDRTRLNERAAEAVRVFTDATGIDLLDRRHHPKEIGKDFGVFCELRATLVHSYLSFDTATRYREAAKTLLAAAEKVEAAVADARAALAAERLIEGAT